MISAARSPASSWIAHHIGRLSRFSIIGGIVTLVSTSANVGLLKLLHTPLIVTWVCVYCAAITVSYILNSHFTFGSELAGRRMMLYFGVYLSSMVLGVVVLKVYRALLPFENWVLPLLVLPVTAVVNYGLSSTFMRRRFE